MVRPHVSSSSWHVISYPPAQDPWKLLTLFTVDVYSHQQKLTQTFSGDPPGILVSMPLSAYDNRKPSITMELMADLPEHAQAEVARILDAEAARLLSEQLDNHPVSPTARMDGDVRHHGADEVPASVEREPVPVNIGTDLQSGVSR